MKTQLQAMRKRAGYKSARSFALHMDISVGTYTDYEQGRRSLTLEKAWEFADALDCTLDELAGRKPPDVAYDDPYQQELNDCWEQSSDDGRRTIISVARSVRQRGDAPAQEVSA